MLFRVDGTNRVLISMPRGIYRLSMDSGCGKTYLVNILHSLYRKGSTILTYTYADYLRGVPVIPDGTDTVDFLIMDRCDLYCDDISIAEQLKNIPSSATIVMDIKGTGGLLPPAEGFVYPKIVEGGVELCL